jgi:hypothetical protein
VNKRLGQILLWITAIFAIAASPITACACSHHETKPIVNVAHEHSCGQKSSAEGQSEQEGDASDTEILCKSGADCSCIQPTPKAPAKSETAKIKKHGAALLSISQPVEAVAVSFRSAPVLSQVTPFYRDPFGSSESTRGPPVS